MAKTEEGDKGEEKCKVLEEQPQLRADRGRIRSKEDEEALDKKIAEIRKKNQLIEQRKELVEEDRANFVSEYGKTGLYSRARWPVNRNKRTSKPTKPRKVGEWDREWDAGKTSVENWKENVPDIDKNTRPGAHFPRGFKNRNRNIKNNSNSSNNNNSSSSNNNNKNNINNNNNNVIINNNNNNNKSNDRNASKNVPGRMNEKRKPVQTKFTVFVETNRKVPLPNKKVLSNIMSDKKKATDFVKTRPLKLFDNKNQKSFGSGGFGDGGTGGVLLKSTHLATLKPLSSFKPFHTSFNRGPTGQHIRNYKKPSGFSKRYCSRRVAPVTPIPLSTTPSTTAAATQQLDTVKLNVSTFGLKEETEAITKNNNNCDSNSNDANVQKLTTTVDAATAATAPAPPIIKEHGNKESDAVVAEEVKTVVEEMLLQIE